MVEGEMFLTIPFSFATLANSVEDQSDKGLSNSRGSVQARAVTWALSVEGKKTRCSRTFRTFDGAFLPPAAPPFLYCPKCATYCSGNLMAGPIRMFIGGNNDFCSNNFGMRRFEKSSDVFKFFIFFCSQFDFVSGFGSTRHRESLLF